MQVATRVPRRASERGEGNFGALIGLIVFVAVAYAGWNVVPLFVTDYAFKDKLTEFARLPRGQYNDEMILDKIMREVRDQGLHEYIERSQVKVKTVENSRRIYVDYERTTIILPGWKKTFKFVDDVEQPLLF